MSKIKTWTYLTRKKINLTSQSGLLRELLEIRGYKLEVEYYDKGVKKRKIFSAKEIK